MTACNIEILVFGQDGNKVNSKLMGDVKPKIFIDRKPDSISHAEKKKYEIGVIRSESDRVYSHFKAKLAALSKL